MRKPSQPPQRRRKRPRKSRSGWRDRLLQFLIAVVLVVDVVLVYFIVRQCSRPEPVAEEVAVEEEPASIQIEVLNGCGVPEVAARFTDFLRARGFDVVKTANFEEEFGRPNFNVNQTVVIDRRGNLRNGVRIAEALGLGESRVIQQVNEAYLIDASVVLGKDFRELSAWQGMER